MDRRLSISDLQRSCVDLEYVDGELRTEHHDLAIDQTRNTLEDLETSEWLPRHGGDKLGLAIISSESEIASLLITAKEDGEEEIASLQSLHPDSNEDQILDLSSGAIGDDSELPTTTPCEPACIVLSAPSSPRLRAGTEDCIDRDIDMQKKSMVLDQRDFQICKLH